MTTLRLTHDPILNSSAQVLILPVNSTGIFLDPILMPLIRYKGLRTMALLTRPLLSNSPKNNPTKKSHTSNVTSLDWDTVTLSLLAQHLQDIPKARVDIHLHKSITI